MFTVGRSRIAEAASRLSAPLPIDAYLRLIDPLWSPATGVEGVCATVRGRVEAVVTETSRAVTLVIRPAAGWAPHRPGQWVRLGVDVDGVRHQRCYSLTSVPGRADGCISVTVQAIPDGLVSNHLVRTARRGTIVHLAAADGDFVLPAGPLPPLLFVTGGSGITPVMGMLRTLAAGPGVADAVVLHHAPTAEQVIFAAELDSLAARFPGLRVATVLTGAGAPPPSARLTAERLDQACPDWRARAVWACGPAPLLADAETTWAAAGLGDALHVERFRPAFAPLDAPTAGGHVRFTASAATAMADGHTPLLEVAEAAGLTPEHGCRMGICHGCTTTLLAGCVRDLRDGTLTRDEGSIVQICVNAAAGDVSLAL